MGDNSIYWLNLFGDDVRLRLSSSGQNDNISIYQPKPRSLINANGFSVIHPDYFNETLIFPILEKKFTIATIPLNKIIALNAIENANPENFNSETIYWDKDDQIIVNKIRDSIRQNKFDITDARGIYASELPGGYYLLTGGCHRVIAMILENIPHINLQVNPIKDSTEFQFIKPSNEYLIKKAIDDKKIVGKILDDPEIGKKLILKNPTVIDSPLKLFGGIVSDELIDILAQTLPF
jgi:hypothetical protein